MSTCPPPGFPSGIPCSGQRFTNWDGALDVRNICTCTPGSADDVVAVCNWAAANNWQVRASGIRHNWSWLTITPDTAPGSDVMIVNTTTGLAKVLSVTPASGGQPAQVKVQTGCTMDNLMLALEQAAGGTGAAPGFSFPHIPAPGHLTIGAVLAIDAHGTAIPAPTENFPSGYGSMSNRILAFTAVVSGPTPGVYQLQTFTRGQAGGDDNAFLTHLGRAFLVDVTLEVIPNYNLQCQSYTNIGWQSLFAAPTSVAPIPTDSLASFLAQTGRVEAIWYPFSEFPWLKVWTNAPVQPAGTQIVNTPYNYPFSDNLPPFVTGLIELILGIPVDVPTLIAQIVAWLFGLGKHPAVASAAVSPLTNQIAEGWQIITCIKNAIANGGGPLLTPCFGQIMQLITNLALSLNNSNIWGPSKNTMIYIKDSTLRVTADGYAVSMKKENVQRAVYEFVTIHNALLNAFQKKGQYPVNAPLEIRVTGLDNPADIAAVHSASPAISALNYDQEAVQNGWDVALWLDVLTIPNTPNSNDFYTQLEAALIANPWFNGTNGRIRPEWSKGWAYTANSGAWTSQPQIDRFKATFTGWSTEQATLAKYDGAGLYTNPFLTGLFS
jgi:hypothetical protein